MKPRVLVTYASRHGSTAEVAATIAEALQSACDFAVTLTSMAEFEPPAAYDAIIIGTAIYADQWLPDAEDYLQHFANELQARPVAFFNVCMVAANSDDDSKALLRQYHADAHARAIKPVAVGIFAGQLSHNGLYGLDRWLVTVKHLPPGDYRDWDYIRAWALEACEALQIAIGS